MNKEIIKELLYKNFIKWYNNVYWSDEKIKPKEKQVKQYLGYFGVNRREKRLEE